MQSITTEQLMEMQKANRDQKDDEFVLIDVLPEDKHRAMHIAGSENIPLTEENFVEAVEERVGEKDRPVVVYCASFSCEMSSQAARKLEEAGFTNVHDYEGGTKAWQEAGLPVEGETIHA